MLIAKLSISYDRGVSRNNEKDLSESQSKILKRGDKTADGKIIRGLGSHFRSEADAELVKQRDAAYHKIYNAFRSRFLATPIEGLYFVPVKGAAQEFISEMEIRMDMRVRVTEFELFSPEELDVIELAEWSKRIKNQLQSISLGRTKEADQQGLDALLTLASCPLIKKETAMRVRELVSMVRAGRLDRIEIKRSLNDLDVKIDTAELAPRSMPTIMAVS